MMVDDTAGCGGQVWSLVHIAEGFVLKLHCEIKLQKACCWPVVTMHVMTTPALIEEEFLAD